MIGKTITHYKIIEKIGGGGMGVVYKARDLKLDRFVALKFLPQHLTTNETEKKRFIHEAKAASALDHNNICAIHEIDESDDGQLFITMAYYEGKTLDKRIEEKPSTIQFTIDLAIQISKGLVKAHEKQIVHRDIKPANIMLTADGVVKILDFGLAKLRTQTVLTKESTTLGTIAYMSPEQTEGENIDYRTDTWSLGVMLYEMLTGELPFKGEYESAIIYSIINESQEPVTALRSGVPMELERIINKCLQKNPVDRYQHVDELIVDLNALKSESAIISTVNKNVHKKQIKYSYLPIGILFIVCLMVIGYFMLQPDSNDTFGWENSIAVLPFADLSPDKGQEYFCDGMTEQIITNLSKIERLKVIARTSVMTYKNTNKQIPEIGKELNVNHILEGSIRKHGNSIRVTAQLINTTDGSHIWADDFDRELKHTFEVQDDVSKAIASKLVTALSVEEERSIKTNRPKSMEVYEYFLKGKYFHYMKAFGGGGITKIKREEYLKQAEEMFKKAIELDPNFADSYAGLVDVYNSQYNYIAVTDDQRHILMRLQEEYLEKAFKLDSLSAEAYYVKNFIHQAKTRLYYRSEEYDKVESEIIKTYESLLNSIRINNRHSKAYYILGYFMIRRGLDELAINYIQKSLELNPLWNLAYLWLGNAHYNTGEFTKAEGAFQKVLDFNIDDLFALSRLLRLQIAQKRYTEAKNTLAYIQKLYPDQNIDWERALLDASEGINTKILQPHIYKSMEIYSLLGLTDEAIKILTEWSESMLKRKRSQYNSLQTDPFYNNIRSDPRFQEILEKHKVLYEENLQKYGRLEF